MTTPSTSSTTTAGTNSPRPVAIADSVPASAAVATTARNSSGRTSAAARTTAPLTRPLHLPRPPPASPGTDDASPPPPVSNRDLHPFARRNLMRGVGRAAFAATLLVIAGVLNIIYGMGALDDANVLVNDKRYVFSNLHTMGWVLIVLGLIQLTGGFSLFGGNTWGRVVGV